MSSDWYSIRNEEAILSPALLVYPDRVLENIGLMVSLAGGAERLRPHVKTYKMPQIVRMQLEAGITKFKCATTAELEMTLAAGARDVLVAYPLVGPAVGRALDIAQTYPDRRVILLADHANALSALEREASARNLTVPVMVDIDNGMHRTGISPGPEAHELYRELHESAHLEAAGLHIYDGHIHEADPVERESVCRRDFEPVEELIRRLHADSMPTPELVCGGTPTFPIHARFPERTVSPGTTLFWDYGYGSQYEDLPFLHAAAVLTRVVSTPQPQTVCLDLGVKAVAADKPQPRVWFPQLPEAEPVGHSEEHLVLAVPEAAMGDARAGGPAYPARGSGAGAADPGAVLYGIPRHICPTVALYDEVHVVRDGVVRERWPVVARGRGPLHAGRSGCGGRVTQRGESE